MSWITYPHFAHQKCRQQTVTSTSTIQTKSSKRNSAVNVKIQTKVHKDLNPTKQPKQWTGNKVTKCHKIMNNHFKKITYWYRSFHLGRKLCFRLNIWKYRQKGHIVRVCCHWIAYRRLIVGEHRGPGRNRVKCLDWRILKEGFNSISKTASVFCFRMKT